MNVGSVSEDIIVDRKRSAENGLPIPDGSYGVDSGEYALTPTGQIINKAFDNNPSARTSQDIGLDGMNDDVERILLKNYLTAIELEPNDWLIAKDSEALRWQMATPDGLSPGHELIAEVKTTGRDWGEWRNVPGNYHRQVQWQLYVTGANACVFGWMLREKKNGEMVPGWPGPKFVVVERDDALIERLIEVAGNLYRELPLASS